MGEQILAPLDESELAEHALPTAARLAQAVGGRLHLVRVIDLLAHATWAPIPAFVPANVYAREEQETRAYLTTQQERLAATGLAVLTATPTGDVGAALLDYEREAQITLVVLCSHGRSGLARFALGSVAERLLRYGTAPLLLVRAYGAPLTLAQVVVPLDGSARAEQALEALQGLLGTMVRQVTLLRVIATPEEGPEAERYLAAVAPRLSEHLSVCRRVEQGDPAERIAAVAGVEALVVMATHGRTGVTRWALGSVADRVAHSPVAGMLLLRVASGDAHAGQ